MKVPTDPTELPLLATCWTIAGNVLPTEPDPASPFPLERRLAAAARAGYRGIGLWHGDLVEQRRQPGGLGALRQQLDALGLEAVELEFLTDWFCTGELRERSDNRRREFLRAAGQLGARHLKVIPPMPGHSVNHAELVDAFGVLCEEARIEGLSIAMEMMPMSALPTLEDSVAVVQAAAADNGGLLLDIWHVMRAGCTDVRSLAQLPAGTVNAVELNDASLMPGPDLFRETLDGRLPCGEGEFDVAGFVAALWQAGYRGPVGVEILSDRFRSMEPETAARISHDSALGALAAARQTPVS